MDEIIKPSTKTSINNFNYIQDAKSDRKGMIHRHNHVSGQVEKGIEINGNGFINLGNFVNTCLGKPSVCSNGMTVSLWLKYKLSEERQYLLGTSGSDVRKPGFVIYQDMYINGSNYIAVSVRTGQEVWTTRVAIPWDTWTHVLFSWSPRDGLSIHTNGTLAGRLKNSTQTLSMQNSNTSFTLGKANNEGNISRATYDELAVWYMVLTDKEAKAIYARTSGIDFEAIHAKQMQGE
jgi:hypothetical protein